MIYAIAAIIALLLGGAVWLYVQGRKSGRDKHEVGIRRGAARHRKRADEIMSEPVADESEWLDAQRKRLQDDSDG